MNLVTRSPFYALEDILGRYSNVKRHYNYLTTEDADRGELTVADWTPSIDISEQKDAYTIKAELPGVTKDDVNVTLENSVLSIRGEKRFEKATDEGKTHRVECAYGQFVRSFTLPESVQDDKVEATYKDGVLNLLIPKAPHVQAKAIDINVQ